MLFLILFFFSPLFSAMISRIRIGTQYVCVYVQHSLRLAVNWNRNKRKIDGMVWCFALQDDCVLTNNDKRIIFAICRLRYPQRWMSAIKLKDKNYYYLFFSFDPCTLIIIINRQSWRKCCEISKSIFSNCKRHAVGKVFVENSSEKNNRSVPYAPLAADHWRQ